MLFVVIHKDFSKNVGYTDSVDFRYLTMLKCSEAFAAVRMAVNDIRQYDH